MSPLRLDSDPGAFDPATFTDGHGFARGLEARRAIAQIDHMQGESNLWLILWTNG
jgi:hypothetical protein